MVRSAFLAACASLAAISASTAARADVDWGQVETTLGRPASVQANGVHRFGLPRTDLNVTVDGVLLRPAFALGSWLAFKEVNDHAVVMGDLVLLEGEVLPVRERLLDGGIGVTALHNHLLRARPMPMYMHVMGEGDAVALARTLHTALTASGTPLDASPRASAAPTTGLDTSLLDRIIGRKGAVNGDVYQFGIPRAESIRLGDLVVPPSMGAGVGINFQPTEGGRAAITGDFVLLGDEVGPVMRILTQSDIEVTALHNHMLAEEPRLFFMHFWANADPAKLARGVRAALDLIQIEQR